MVIYFHWWSMYSVFIHKSSVAMSTASSCSVSMGNIQEQVTGSVWLGRRGQKSCVWPVPPQVCPSSKQDPLFAELLWLKQGEQWAWTADLYNLSVPTHPTSWLKSLGTCVLILSYCSHGFFCSLAVSSPRLVYPLLEYVFCCFCISKMPCRVENRVGTQ